ncbi:hypothetical protein ASE00_19405 [Sphingomonas sp. Root710]|uniref:hypothetical protein n=1 Tax=Sphingomonas sp. Root710 TaxID=1736594 RepID=UPI0006F424CA|nr:hypothetical protein [Sphingomonas sp. Root710]KRB79865.1 hypothetical protein ASE00_19405 [Sphingomonas sp. Root710]
MLSTALGALIGSAIDGADGDDPTADGAIIGAATATVARVLVPMAFTYFVGWAVLKGVSSAKDALLGTESGERANSR